MAAHAIELGHHHADPGGTLRYLHLQQRLHRQREHQLVVERAEIIHPGDVGAALQEGEPLRRLFHTGMEISDHWFGAQYLLTLELHHHAQHSMGGWVLGAHVDDHRLIVTEFNVVVIGVK